MGVGLGVKVGRRACNGRCGKWRQLQGALLRSDGSMALCRFGCLLGSPLCSMLLSQQPGPCCLAPGPHSPVGHGCAHRGVLEGDPPAGDEVVVEQVLASQVLRQEEGYSCGRSGCAAG